MTIVEGGGPKFNEWLVIHQAPPWSLCPQVPNPWGGFVATRSQRLSSPPPTCSSSILCPMGSSKGEVFSPHLSATVSLNTNQCHISMHNVVVFKWNSLQWLPFPQEHNSVRNMPLFLSTHTNLHSEYCKVKTLTILKSPFLVEIYIHPRGLGVVQYDPMA